MRFLLALILCFNLKSSNSDLSQLRDNFKRIDQEEEVVLKMQSIIAGSKMLDQGLKNAYGAAAEMASAKFKINPVSKLNVFNSGKKKLEQCISENRSNLEIRYIRFAIQKKVPDILRYNKDLESDKKFLIQNLKSLKFSDTELYANIYAFLLINCNLTPEEKKEINA